MQVTNIVGVQTDLALDGVYGLSSYRNQSVIVGSGTITNVQSEIKLTTDTAVNSITRLSTSDRSRCIPGSDTYCEISARVPLDMSSNAIVPTSTQNMMWGLYDDNEGYGFGLDATGFYTFYKTGGTVTKMRQTAWAVDKMDGTGPSALTLNSSSISLGTIFTLRSTWYGGIEYGLIRPDAGLEIVTVHHVKVQQPMYLSPYLPIRGEVNNNSTTTQALSLIMAVRKISQVATGNPTVRPVSHSMQNVALTHQTLVPMLSFSRKTSTTCIPVKFKSLEITATQPMLIYIINGMRNESVSYTWSNPNGIITGETACQVDITGTALNPTYEPSGNMSIVYQALLPAGYTLYEFDPNIVAPTEFFATVIAGKVYGTTDGTATFNLQWTEQW